MPPDVTATGLPWRTRMLLGSFMLVIAAMVGIAGWTLADAREEARHEAEQHGRNIALTLEQSIDRTITSLDLSLRAAQRGMATPGLAALDPAIRQAVLFSGAAPMNNVMGVYVTDRFGQIRYGTKQLPVLPAVTDRSYFQNLRDHDGLGLMISETVRARTSGDDVIVLARRIDTPDGSFDGIVFLSCRLTVFSSLFAASIDLGPDSSITLYGPAGDVIARRPALQPDGEGRLDEADLRARLANPLPPAREVVSRGSGRRRLVIDRPVGSLPLLISVGISTSVVYAEWWHKVATLGGATIVLCLVGCGLILLLRRAFQRRIDAEVEARRSERKHFAALARLDTLFQASTDSMMIIRVEPDGRFTYEAVNPVWESLTGLQSADAVGLPPDALLPAEHATRALTAFHTCLHEGRIVRFDFESPRLGDHRHWEAMIAPVRSEDGHIRRLVAIARDITERKQMEQSLLQNQRLEAVGQLTAGIAHDFNNLLQGIISAVELLGEQPNLDEEGRECVAIASRASQHGANLVHRLLAFTHQQVLRPARLGPAQVFLHLVPLLKQTLGGRVRIETDVAANVGDAHVDCAMLEGCLLNLAVNAGDAMPQGGVLCLRAANRGPEDAVAAGLPASEYVCFTVEDSGVGMPPETLARVFEPFFTTKGIGKGTGLGLSMVLGFVRQSGGEVRIASTPGLGTAVSLWLPRLVESAVSVHEAARRTAEFGKGRVMIVDDVATVRQTLSIMLAKDGFVPLSVGSAEAALALFQAGEPCDLLVTDQSMPGLSGIDLIAEVARLRPELPSLLISGYDMLIGLDRVQGNVTLLRKPFDRELFLKRVNMLIGAATTVAALDASLRQADAVTSNVVRLRTDPVDRMSPKR